jgi:hypothetical protein
MKLLRAPRLIDFATSTRSGESLQCGLGAEVILALVRATTQVDRSKL